MRATFIAFIGFPRGFSESVELASLFLFMLGGCFGIAFIGDPATELQPRPRELDPFLFPKPRPRDREDAFFFAITPMGKMPSAVLKLSLPPGEKARRNEGLETAAHQSRLSLSQTAMVRTCYTFHPRGPTSREISNLTCSLIAL